MHFEGSSTILHFASYDNYSLKSLGVVFLWDIPCVWEMVILAGDVTISNSKKLQNLMYNSNVYKPLDIYNSLLSGSCNSFIKNYKYF